MSTPLSRRDFSRCAALAGLGVGIGGVPQAALGLSEEVRVPTAAIDQGGRLAPEEFPQQRDGVYLNHAASSPLPRRTSDALQAHLADRQRLFHLYQSGTQDYALPTLQAKVGLLLRVPAELVGFVPTTTEAMSAALNSIDWRAGNIIRKFSGESQFIVVTHNKRTMASTDVMYGITMIEAGISRVIPVDLRQIA